MRISTINVSSVMLETKIFEIPNPTINVEELIKPKRTKSIAKLEKGIRAMPEGDTFLNLK